MLRDGYLVNQFHRSAFVAELNAEVIEDTFDVYGLLWSRASAKVGARTKDLWQLAEMEQTVATLRSLSEPRDIDVATYQYRRRISHLGGTQRLRALLRSFRTFVPAGYRQSVPDLALSQSDGIQAEFKAIARGNAELAGARTRTLYQRQASVIIADLRSKGVVA